MDHEISFERFYRALRDISASLHSDTRVEDVLKTVARKSTEVLDAKGAIIRILNSETHQLELHASYGLGEKFLARGPVSKTNVITNLCQSNKIIIIRDILHDPRVQYPQEAWA